MNEQILIALKKKDYKYFREFCFNKENSLILQDSCLSKSLPRADSDLSRSLSEFDGDPKIDKKGIILYSIFECEGKEDIPFLKFLISCGADPHFRWVSTKWSALHEAAYSGLLLTTKFLVEDCKTDINALDELKQSPLHKAARKGRFEVAKYLVENGAKIDQKDFYGDTPLEGAIKRQNEGIRTYSFIIPDIKGLEDTIYFLKNYNK